MTEMMDVEFSISNKEIFNEEYKRTHGSYPKGDYQHWCIEWDDMPLDSECLEIFCCPCYEDTEEFKAIKKKWQEELDKINEVSAT